jgi:hypothetical protein
MNFHDSMDELQREVESDGFSILYKKLDRLPSCKEYEEFLELNPDLKDNDWNEFMIKKDKHG